MLKLSLLLILCALLLGCGQKGDLYLPAARATTPLLDVR